MNKKDLIRFEDEVVREFKKGETYGPVHLSGGNETELLKIFKKVKKDDWVFSNHRSHYHALLKSNDPIWLMKEIIVKANSSHINSKKHKIFTSAIVGGILPIALGTALAIKRKGLCNQDKIVKSNIEVAKNIIGTKIILPHVWCFVGDFAAEMGCFHEAVRYAESHNLPITFVIEDNELGCNTPYGKVWKGMKNIKSPKVIHYKYVRKYPHYGIGEWVIMAHEKVKTQGDYNAYK